MNNVTAEYIYVMEDWIYLTIFQDGPYRMKIDGTGNQMLYKGDIDGFTIFDDWIGFSIWDDNYNITNIRVKTDGSMDEVTS